jgi:hypothetical protein
VEGGELVPQKTLNRFREEEEEWTIWEKILIAAKEQIFFLSISFTKKIASFFIHECLNLLGILPEEVESMFRTIYHC